MDLGWSLLIWLAAAIIVFILARRYGIRAWSAFALAILVAAIFLGIFRPANTVAWGANQAGLSGLYWLIMFLTPLLLIIYIVSKAVTDTPERAGYSRF